MQLKYDGLRDPHLNVFYSYGNKSHIENNITKAFVNTLKSLFNKDFKKTIEALFGFELSSGKYTVSYYLLKKPKKYLHQRKNLKTNMK